MMRDKRNLGLIILISVVYVAQSQGLSTASTPKYVFAVSYTPALTFRELQFDEQHKFLESQRNQMETPMYGYSTALAVQRNLNKRSLVELGVSFSSIGYKTQAISLYWEPSRPDYPVSTWAAFSYQYISLTARYKYILNGKKVQFYVAPGLSVDGLLHRKTRVYTRYNDKSEQKSVSTTREGYSKANISIILALGAKVNLSQRYALCVEPTYWRGLISVIPENNNKEFLYAFGLTTQFIFYFKK